LHEGGAVCIAQLGHAGPSQWKKIPEQPVAASSLAGVDNPQPAYPQARGLSISEIQSLVEKFAWGAERSKRAGFDGVEIHGAHNYFMMSIVNIKLLGLTALGTLAGIYIGAIPGLSVTMAVSILISFTFSWELNPALCLMIGIWTGGVYGGSRSSILLNIPGAPAAVATGFDGYPLAKLGEAGKAIGLSTTASVIGGFMGVIALIFAAPLISEFSLKFAPRDYFLLAVMGILLVGSLSGESLAKGIFAGALGILLSLVGMDNFTGQARFAFGSVGLMSGIHFVAIMIGLFGVSEALVQLRDINLMSIKQDVRKILPAWSLLFKHLYLIIKSALIGIGIGALPGAGGDIAALLAYGHARRSVKHPTRPFGEGAYEGIIAPETANNGAIGGAYIPMITLGDPRGRGDGGHHRRTLHPRLEARPDADDRNAPPFLVFRRLHVGGERLSADLRPDRDPGLRQDGGDPQGAAAADHHRHLHCRRLCDQQQHLRCLLDARFWDRRLFSEAVRLPGRTGHPWRHPRADHGDRLPASDDGSA